MEEQGPSVAVSDDILVSGLPVEIFTEFDVNMDNVVEIDTEGESTGKIPSTSTIDPTYNEFIHINEYPLFRLHLVKQECIPLGCVPAAH